MNTIGDRIRSARVAAGMHQAELAKRAGVARQAIESIEAGRVSMPRALKEIAEALGTSVDALLGLNVSESAPIQGRARRKLSPDAVELICEDPKAAAARMVAISKARHTSRYGK
jgi:transcriptional regulator with XRE-family HTH domain